MNVDQKTRQGARLTLVALFLAGGVLLWDHLQPVEADVAFRVPSRIKATSTFIPRAELERLTARIVDEDSETVATINLTLSGLMKGPVTPPVRLRLPAGEYVVYATVNSKSSHAAEATGELTLGVSGYTVTNLTFFR